MASNLAKAYVDIIPKAEGIEGKLKSMLKPGANKAGSSAGSEIGKQLVSTLKKVITSAAIGMFVKNSLMEGAAIQQSMGGIETLFKSSADTMKQYATQAYRTAGISANQYMEQATSFSASLLQSLNGDTAKAATASNQAIIDMADNANKMGTSLESIQNAYQGFAKGNYTMLDNLKLGYGGTKTEMERLIKDANALKVAHGELGDLSIEKFSDIIEAIHLTQNQLGITGTTAKEAAQTFSGSFQSMKAAASNFMASLTGVTDEAGNAILSVEDSMSALIQSALTFLLDNLLPMLGNIVAAIPKAIAQAFKFESGIISSQLTELWEVVENGFYDLVDFLKSQAPTFIQQGFDMITNLAVGLVENLPTIVAKGIELVTALKDGIIANVPSILEGATRLVLALAEAILSNAPQLLTSGIQLIAQLAIGLVQGIPTALASAVKCAWQIIDYFGSQDWQGVGRNIIDGIKNGITGAIKNLVSAGIQACKELNASIKNFFGIHSPSIKMRDEIGRYIPEGLAIGITANMDSVFEAMDELDKATFGSIDVRSFDFGRDSLVDKIDELIDKVDGRKIVVQNNTTIEMDGKKVAQATAPYTQQEIDKIEKLKNKIKGVNL